MTATSSEGALGPITSGDPVFASRLHRLLGRQPGNLFYAPASIRLALGMAYAGAAGSTAQEMASTLALPASPPGSTHRGFGELLRVWSAWERLPREPQNQWERADLERARMTFHVVSRLFGQRGYAFRADFLSVLRDAYGAPLAEVEFGAAEATRTLINDWVADQTAQKIRDLLAPGMITEDMRLVLCNAVHFKASWASTFVEYWTQPGAFFVDATDSVQVPLMTQTSYFDYAEVDGAQLLQLPYGAGDVAMLIVLPRARDGLPALEARMQDGSLERWAGALRPRNVHLVMPRFGISSGFRLKETLSALGMKSAFEFGPADFSGMDGTRLLYIGDVIHKAFVDVDEKGTEAAAATAVVAVAGGPPQRVDPPVELRADHPFLFCIRDVRRGSVLFMGRLARPDAR